MNRDTGESPSSGGDIILSALEGDIRSVRRLLSEGVDANTVEQVGGFTALHIACMQGNDELVDIILQHDQITNSVDFAIRTYDSGLFAWQVALEYSHLELAQKVDAAGARKRPNPSERPSPKA